MNLIIESIAWPTDEKQAVRVYISLLVKIISKTNITFNGKVNDPIYLATSYLNGKLSEEQKTNALNEWWHYLDSSGAIRDFTSQDALMARLAICLLCVTESDSNNLGEHLAWFFRVLGYMGIDLEKPVEIVTSHPLLKI